MKNVSREFLYAVVDSAQTAVRHYADDESDGKFDALVIEEFDPDRPMVVVDWAVRRSSSPAGPVDEAWGFHSDNRERRRAVDTAGARGSRHPPAVIASELRRQTCPVANSPNALSRKIETRRLVVRAADLSSGRVGSYHLAAGDPLSAVRRPPPHRCAGGGPFA